jgi:hypothetical protein
MCVINWEAEGSSLDLVINYEVPHYVTLLLHSQVQKVFSHALHIPQFG